MKLFEMPEGLFAIVNPVCFVVLGLQIFLEQRTQVLIVLSKQDPVLYISHALWEFCSCKGK